MHANASDNEYVITRARAIMYFFAEAAIALHVLRGNVCKFINFFIEFLAFAIIVSFYIAYLQVNRTINYRTEIPRRMHVAPIGEYMFEIYLVEL